MYGINTANGYNKEFASLVEALKEFRFWKSHNEQVWLYSITDDRLVK